MLRRAPVKLALFGVLSAVLLLPGVLYALTRSANPFVYYRVARAEIFSTAGHLLPVDIGGVIFHPFRLGTELLIVPMSQVTGLPVEVIHYLPLGAVFTVVAYLALTKRVTGSFLLAYLVAFSIAFDGMMIASYDSAFIWSWVHGITALSILSLFRFLQSRQASHLVVLMVLYLGILTLHTVAVFWTILLAFAVALLVLAARAATRKSPTFAIAYTLPLLFLVAELAFDDAFYISLKHFVQGGYAEDFLTVFLPTIFQKLLGQMAHVQYLWASPVNPVTAWISFVKPVIIIIPLGIYFLVRGVKLVKLAPRRWPSPDPATALLVAITFVGAAHLLTYIVYGGIPSFRYIGLMYPLAAVIALQKLGVKRMIIIGVVLSWGVVSVIGTAGYLKDFPRTPSYQEVKPTYSWLQQYGPLSPAVLTDLDTYGKLAVLGSYDGNLIRFRTYNVNFYGVVVEDDKPTENRLGFLRYDIDYVIITTGPYEGNPVAEGTAWKVYEPLSLYRDNIENNKAMMKVHDDGALNTFITFKELPQRGGDIAGVSRPP